MKYGQRRQGKTSEVNCVMNHPGLHTAEPICILNVLYGLRHTGLTQSMHIGGRALIRVYVGGLEKERRIAHNRGTNFRTEVS